MLDVSQMYSVVFFVVCIVISGYFSSSEIAFTSARPVRLKAEIKKGNKRAEKALHLQQQFESLLSTILIGNNLVNIACSAVATLFFVSIFPHYGGAIATIVTTLTLLFLGEITPKLLAKLAPEKTAMFAQPFLSALMIILKPFVWLLDKWQDVVKRFIPHATDAISEEELLSFVDEARLEGSIEHDEHLLVKAAIEFDDVEVSSIVTPRVDVIGVDITDDDHWIESVFECHSFSRIIVYEDTIDNVVGILHEKDFHRYLKRKAIDLKKQYDLMSIISDVLFVPPSMPVSKLLQLMQRQKNHMAVVIDEHGGMVGIATMEDTLEELVGEIWDETDEIEEELTIVKPNHQYRVKGTYAMTKLFDVLDLEGSYDWLSNTVSGFVIESLGRVPEPGDCYVFNHYSFKVIKTTNRRVTEVLITDNRPLVPTTLDD